jgi:hypothetical protein
VFAAPAGLTATDEQVYHSPRLPPNLQWSIRNFAYTSSRLRLAARAAFVGATAQSIGYGGRVSTPVLILARFSRPRPLRVRQYPRGHILQRASNAVRIANARQNTQFCSDADRFAISIAEMRSCRADGASRFEERHSCRPLRPHSDRGRGRRDLAGAAVAAPIVGNHAIAPLEEEQHLVVPVDSFAPTELHGRMNASPIQRRSRKFCGRARNGILSTNWLVRAFTPTRSCCELLLVSQDCGQC